MENFKFEANHYFLSVKQLNLNLSFQYIFFKLYRKASGAKASVILIRLTWKSLFRIIRRLRFLRRLSSHSPARQDTKEDIRCPIILRSDRKQSLYNLAWFNHYDYVSRNFKYHNSIKPSLVSCQDFGKRGVI